MFESDKHVSGESPFVAMLRLSRAQRRARRPVGVDGKMSGLQEERAFEQTMLWYAVASLEGKNLVVKFRSFLQDKSELTMAANGDKAQLQGRDYHLAYRETLITQQPSSNELPISSSLICFIKLPTKQLSFEEEKTVCNSSESLHSG